MYFCGSLKKFVSLVVHVIMYERLISHDMCLGRGAGGWYVRVGMFGVDATGQFACSKRTTFSECKTGPALCFQERIQNLINSQFVAEWNVETPTVGGLGSMRYTLTQNTVNHPSKCCVYHLAGCCVSSSRTVGGLGSMG